MGRNFLPRTSYPSLSIHDVYASSHNPDFSRIRLRSITWNSNTNCKPTYWERVIYCASCHAGIHTSSVLCAFLTLIQASLSPTESVSIVIGLQNCGSSPCPGNGDEIIGEILFAGDFKPQREEPTMPAYQNFTFNASAIANPLSAHATLHLAHFLLLGVRTNIYVQEKRFWPWHAFSRRDQLQTLTSRMSVSNLIRSYIPKYWEIRVCLSLQKLWSWDIFTWTWNVTI